MNKSHPPGKKINDLIEYFSVPAFTASLTRKKILSGNSLLFRRYGTEFAEKRSFALEGYDPSNPGPQFFTVKSSEPDLVLERTGSENADFELVHQTQVTALFIEPIASPTENTTDSSGQKTKKTSPKSEKRAPFHFSYLHNFVTGNWAYSHPELPARLGLAGPADSGKKFDWRSVIHPEDLPLYDNTIENLRQHGGNHEVHYRIITCENKIIEVNDYCSLTEPDEKWPVMVGSIISSEQSTEEIQKTERQLLAGRLVGGMIHDFKNLLSGIQNYIEWTVSISQNPEVVSALKKTLSYTEQATNLITTALKINTGEKQNRIEKVSFEEMIQKLKNLIRHILPANVTLEINVEKGLPHIYGQESLLQDMLINLCVNARDAMKAKGDLLKITVSSELVPDEHGNPQRFIKLFVSDNGCGMTEEQTQSVFEAFYSTKDKGAGLGMWMVNEAVKAFDGRIEIKSKPGKGTKFKILFPVVKQEETTLDLEEIEQQNPETDEGITENFQLHERKTILYIEDEPLVRSSVSAWLESLGFEIISSADGLEGFNIFTEKHEEIDLVIQDFILPGMKGDKLLEKLLSKKPELPVLVLSANPEEEQIKQFEITGAYAFLSKPFKMVELVKILKEIFDL